MVPAQVLSRILAVQPMLDAVERDQAAPRAAFDHLVIGQAVTGLVKSQAKGVSLVIIEGQTVAMRLPRPVETGDTLKLSFAGHMPQPVFLLEAPETAPTDAPQLSQTARMLSDLMQRVPERTPPTLTPPGPLLDRPTTNPIELALTLRTALVRSGLFYESHLANWADGQDTLPGLMQEPQNRLAAESARLASALVPSALVPSALVTSALVTSALVTSALVTSALVTSGLALPDTSGVADPKSANPMHTLLSQQLQVLESPHFVWRGELWPGQTLEWQVQQQTYPPRDESAAPGVAEGNAGWESHLKLTLPQLGTLNVHIKLDTRQVFSIRIVPEQAEVGPLLQKNQVQLIDKFAAAGCSLHTVMVQADAGA